MLLILFVVPLCIAQNEVVEYLEKYGYYMSSEGGLKTVTKQQTEEALYNFQATYNLPLDGQPNDETLKWMKKSRCGVGDNEFRLHSEKWHKTTIGWYTQYPNERLKQIVERAFQTWQNVCSLQFVYNYRNPDIVISMPDSYGKTHQESKRCRKTTCPFPFDGKGGVLAHAFFPDGSCTEIHLDSSEDWEFISQGTLKLEAVLVHEIGHSLGLHHSSVNTSIMYPFLGNEKLSLDDINGIQALYGPPVRVSSTERVSLPTKTSVTSTTERSVTPTAERIRTPSTESVVTKATRKPSTEISQQDICDREVSELTFLILNKHLYIFHNELVWIMNMENRKFTTRALNYLNILPITTNFDSITAIYQRPNGEIAVFVKEALYLLSYPGYTLIQKKHLKEIHPQFHGKLIGAVNSYTGRTFLFFEGDYYIEIDEHSMKTRKLGYISRDFRGVPSDINGVFRYTNGLLYFFQDGKYFAYNEFLNTLHSSGKIKLSSFGIDCPNLSLYEQLKILLQKILLLHKV